MMAVRERDNYRFGRSRLRVEIARGATGPPAAPPNWRKKGTGYRIVVEGLPRHASWQDLKVLPCAEPASALHARQDLHFYNYAMLSAIILD